MVSIGENKELELAWQLVTETGTSLFLTGKAGTGKTTFLKELQRRAPKRMVVVAPTGVAAINAEGVTIHSFFQLPFSPFVPDASIPREKFMMSKEKRHIIRTMDLLVIDEISMVRSDLLDAVDDVLKRYRSSSKPFGGVQLLMIGDLQQLAPVTVDGEGQLLSKYYHSPYFFDSLALRQVPYATIELTTIYRQGDQNFVSLLNKIRINQMDEEVLKALNDRYIPDFRPNASEGYIRLTTHNQKAQNYNARALEALRMPESTFTGKITGTFPEYLYPTDLTLRLKVGAQVMFVKNDTAKPSRYYNGRIGHITMMEREKVYVHCPGDIQDIVVEKVEWENQRYKINELTKEIETEVEGTLCQLPLKLAWAITIHKSQGLTFDKAIIDAQSAFAHGQVYVALSRCRTLEGIVLASPIVSQAVINDGEVNRFMIENNRRRLQTEEQLTLLKQVYYKSLLVELFDFSALMHHVEAAERLLLNSFSRSHPLVCESFCVSVPVLKKELMEVAQKFQNICHTSGIEALKEDRFQQRIKDGCNYFHTLLSEKLWPLLRILRIESGNKALAKRWNEVYDALSKEYQHKNGVLKATAFTGFDTMSYLRNKQMVLMQTIDVEKPKKGRSKRKKLF